MHKSLTLSSLPTHLPYSYVKYIGWPGPYHWHSGLQFVFAAVSYVGLYKIREVNGKHGPPPWQSPSQKREADMEP